MNNILDQRIQEFQKDLDTMQDIFNFDDEEHLALWCHVKEMLWACYEKKAKTSR